MSTSFPHLSLWARALLTCLTLVALGLAGQAQEPSQNMVPVQPTVSDSADVIASALAKTGSPDALAEVPAPAPASAAPTPVPVQAVGPQWARAKVDTPLYVGEDSLSAAMEFVPRGAYLKLLGVGASRLHVYYDGDGHDHKAGEGWVSVGDVVISDAPQWVQTRHGTSLFASASTASGTSGSLPAGAVLEVLGEQGKMVHVYYLYDGSLPDSVEGWVDAADLGPAGPTLDGLKRGVRLLTRADVQALQAGQGVWLRVPYRSQLDGSPSADANCGPASIGMVLQFFHTTLPTSEVRKVADRLQGTSDPEGGFAIEFLAGAVRQLGLKWLDLFSTGDKLRSWTINDAKAQLGQGHPVIAELRYRAMPGRGDSDYGEDHYVVLTGVRGDDFVYNDPVDADGRGYGRILSTESLKRAWGGSLFPFAAFAVSTP